MYDIDFREKETSKMGPMTQIHVSIDEPVWQKINHWIQKAPGEVSGLGKVISVGGMFRVIDAILVKQENGAASTELDPASVAKAMYELRNTPGHLNFWWHSHVNMNVFWSGTDIDTIREIGRHGFVVSTVLNKKREMLSALYVQASGVIPEIFINALPTQVQSFLSADTVSAWDKEYDEKCKNRQESVTDYRHKTWNRETNQWIDKRTEPEGCADVGDPYEGKYDNEGFAGKTNDDAPVSTLNGRTLLDPITDPYLNTEIIEDWAEDMEATPNYSDAQDFLTLICRGIAKLERKKDITSDVALNLKAEYIERFNISRAEFRPELSS